MKRSGASCAKGCKFRNKDIQRLDRQLQRGITLNELFKEVYGDRVEFRFNLDKTDILYEVTPSPIIEMMTMPNPLLALIPKEPYYIPLSMRHCPAP